MLKILLFDIETCHNIVAAFQLKVDYIQPQNILQERHLISICYKWLGEKTVHSISLLDDMERFNNNPHDDYYICSEFHKVLSEADVIVGHNSDKFDIKVVEGRMLINKLPPLPPVLKIDTLKIAKSRFSFNSNKLDYLGHVLGCGRKIHTDNSLWLKVLAGNVKAIHSMVKYNKQDVRLLEQVFFKLRPYISKLPSSQHGLLCQKPGCGSAKIQMRGVSRNATRTYQRYQCQTCGGWGRLLKAEKEDIITRNI